MDAPIFVVCAANTGVQELLGVTPTRLYPFGEAPEGVARPYVVWQLVGGQPENYLGQRPDVDSYTLQVDVYAATATDARTVRNALRDAIEGTAYIARWGIEGRDQETGNYRLNFDVDWIVQR